MFTALPGGQDIPPCHADVGSGAVLPGASAAGTPPLLCISLPFLKNHFYLGIKEVPLALLCQRRYKPSP